ncbi:hypothetical protein [Candidatus Protochlamydia phocaeensis]|uniref:hypothetical protein n=1 Tax=Candidatus Protochlamydia phocaeensis TaxID=1414722 RepID=UPI000837ED79|nr:hypothetical protein [Candidatus Protochlamydia phocaeensis]
MTNKIETRIFLGYLLNGEIKMHLNQSSRWKEGKWQKENDLVEAYCQEKPYIGFFIEEGLTYNQLRKKEQELKTQLQLYCPKLNLDSHTPYLFPQTFIS